MYSIQFQLSERFAYPTTPWSQGVRISEGPLYSKVSSLCRNNTYARLYAHTHFAFYQFLQTVDHFHKYISVRCIRTYLICNGNFLEKAI